MTSKTQHTVYVSAPIGPLPASDSESLFLLAKLQLSGRLDQVQIVSGDYSKSGGLLPVIENEPKSPLDTELELQTCDGQGINVDAAIFLASMVYLDDLVSHTLFAISANFAKVTRPALSRATDAVSSVYLPQRVRSMHMTRLKHVQKYGWGEALQPSGPLPGLRCDDEEDSTDGPQLTLPSKATDLRDLLPGYTERVEQARRTRKAEDEAFITVVREHVLRPMSTRLGTGEYFLGSSPSELDARLYATLSLILAIDLPNSYLSEVIKHDVPNLAAHYERMATRLPWDTIKPTLSKHISRSRVQQGGEKSMAKSEKVQRFERGRWLWFGGVLVAFVSYVFASGIIAVQFGDDSDEDSDDGANLTRRLLPVRDDDDDEGEEDEDEDEEEDDEDEEDEDEE